MAPHQALLGVRRKWKAWALLLAILALNLGMVYINVRLNSWNRDMYNVLQSRDYPQFKSLLWQFSGLAFVSWPSPSTASTSSRRCRSAGATG
jgi:ABC-type uncharacterized transport system fused permease/ATPase subunit